MVSKRLLREDAPEETGGQSAAVLLGEAEVRVWATHICWPAALNLQLFAGSSRKQPETLYHSVSHILISAHHQPSLCLLLLNLFKDFLTLWCPSSIGVSTNYILLSSF